MKTAQITSLLHSRGFALAVSFVVLVCAVAYRFFIPEGVQVSETGLVLPPAGDWMPTLWVSFACAMAGSAATIVIVLLLNKVHNVMRAITYIFVPFFLAMQIATPEIMTRLSSGVMLAVVVPLCMYLLFNCYRDPSATRQVFLISFLLSVFTATQYCYAFYIPAMLIGCAQMRIFNRRTLAAALMGALTPWILLFGFGIVRPEDISMPQFTSILSEIDLQETLMLFVIAGFTVLCMLVCYTLSVFKTIAYNARARAVNGAFTVVMLTTLVAMCADARNIVAYIPMLNFCAAMETTHYFSTHRAEKSFIAIISILAVYAALFACQIVISE